jgi:putative heme-binding domain-containing protein
LSPEEAAKRMTVPAGFEVEIVAAEPAIVNPVAITFDERGRIWITESLEYPRREAGPGRDRVKVLEDADGDGTAERATVFCEGLNIPSGIAVGHGGVWVANSPDILFYPDADRDLKPDGPAVRVATGFGRDDTHELPNSLTFGPDGWLYGWNGVFNLSEVKSNNGNLYRFTCAIFRIHPKTREFQVWCEGTSNPWGIAINPEGDVFASACVIDHLWHLVESAYYIRQGGPYPPHTWPAGSIVDHTHQKAAYCGIHYFDSPAYPPEYRGKLYFGNIHGNCINVDTLTKNGSTYRAEPAADFLSANDAWFMPVVQKTGPDGCLYILDWYDRYHCYQDANRDPAGIDRLKGRLYRVRYRETPRRAGFDLAAESDPQLVERLGDPNVFDREVAHRLLVERMMARENEPLRNLLERHAIGNAAGRESRLRALQILGASNQLRPVVHGPALGHEDPAFRAWAVRLAGDHKPIDPQVRMLALKSVTDRAPEVRLQAAIAARKLLGSNAIPALLDVLSASADDALIPHVVWQNLLPLFESPHAHGQIMTGLEGTRPEARAGLERLWPRILDRLIDLPQLSGESLSGFARAGLIRIQDARLRGTVLRTLTHAIRDGELAGDRLTALRAGLLEYVREGMADKTRATERGDSLQLAASLGDSGSIEELRRWIADPQVEPSGRSEAFETLVATRDPGALETAARILRDARTPPRLRELVLDALGRLDEPRVGELVLELYPGLGPGLGARAIVLLTEREAWGRALLDAIKQKRIPSADVHLDQVRKLKQTVKDPTSSQMIVEIWGILRDGRNEQRELIVGQMRNHLAKTPGDPVAGIKVFERVCAECHKLHGQGQDVGPDITSNGRNDFSQLLTNVFDSNLVIGAGYNSVTVATKEGRVLTGLLVEQGPERLILRVQGGAIETIPRAEIDEFKQNAISLMPEDLEKQISPQEIADLFGYLCLDKPPSDPTAKRLPGAPEPKRE